MRRVLDDYESARVTSKRFALACAWSAAAIIIAVCVTIALGLLLRTPAHAGGYDRGYASPDMAAYYASLDMPDYPGLSCCGEGDAYYADKTEPCRPSDEDCALVAIITDTRPDHRVLPDGTEINRMHIPVGTRILISPRKLRKHAIPNPTDHNIVFENSGWFPHALCWEPVGGF